MTPSTGFVERNRIAIEARRAAVLALHGEGLAAHRIAARLHVVPRTIERDLTALGLTAPRKWITTDMLEKAYLMLQDGCNYAEIGRTIGCSPQALAHRLPGYALTREQVSELGALGRWGARVLR